MAVGAMSLAHQSRIKRNLVVALQDFTDHPRDMRGVEMSNLRRVVALFSLRWLMEESWLVITACSIEATLQFVGKCLNDIIVRHLVAARIGKKMQSQAYRVFNHLAILALPFVLVAAEGDHQSVWIAAMLTETILQRIRK